MWKTFTKSKAFAMFCGDAQGFVLALAGSLGWTGDEPWVQVIAIVAGTGLAIASTLGFIKTEGMLDKAAMPTSK